MYRFPLILLIIAGILAGAVAYRKGRNYFFWAVLCFFFPPLIFILLLLPSVLSGGRTKQCSYCAKIINQSDIVCKYCNREQPINLVQCKECGSYVPEKHACEQCNKKMRP
jgi:hypothetical protein